jgi:hypothetical protein
MAKKQSKQAAPAVPKLPAEAHLVHTTTTVSPPPLPNTTNIPTDSSLPWKAVQADLTACGYEDIATIKVDRDPNLAMLTIFDRDNSAKVSRCGGGVRRGNATMCACNIGVVAWRRKAVVEREGVHTHT